MPTGCWSLVVELVLDCASDLPYLFIMKFKILAILWMVLIFVTSSTPSYDFPQVNWWGWAKIIHLIYFGVLCLLLRQILLSQKVFPLLAGNATFFAIFLATCYGVTDEIHQLFTAGRHSQLSDVFVDALGACLFFAGMRLIQLLRTKRAGVA